MSRKEFMEQLEKLLMDIPQEERLEALTYYHGYFEDAGAENEESIIRELESPEAVAAIIKADIGMEEQKKYTETGYSDARFEQKEEMIRRTADRQTNEQEMAGNGYGGANSSGPSGYGSGRAQSARASGYGNGGTQNSGASGYGSAGSQNNRNAGNQGDRTLKVVLLVIVAVFTSPIWLGLLAAGAGILLGIAGTVLGCLVALTAVVLAFYVIGFLLAGLGVGAFTVGGIATGCGLSAAGLILLALAIVGTVGCVWLFGKFLPWLVRGLVSLCSRPFQGRRSTI